MTSFDALSLYGIAGYSATVGLAVLWVGIASAYMVAGRSRWMWGIFAGGACCYALQYIGLSLIAAAPPWLADWRTADMLINRTLVLLGASQLWVFTWIYLHYRWQTSKDKP